MVGDEGEQPVLARIGSLEAIEVGAVGLDRVDVVLLGVADLDVVKDEAVRAVGPDADVLDRPDRRAVTRGGVAGIDGDGVRRGAGALDLQVAADAGTGVGNDVTVAPRGLRDGSVGQLTASSPLLATGKRASAKGLDCAIGRG